MKKKISVLLIAVLMSLVMMVVACSPSKTVTPDPTTGESTPEQSSDDGFPGRVSNLNGRVITINMNGSIDQHSRGGKARLARDKEIEEKYNITIEYLVQHNETGGNYDIVNSVLAGKPIVDIWVQNGWREVVPHYRQGSIMALDDLEVFDWSEYSENIKVGNFGGKQYIVDNKINSSGGGSNDIWATYVMFYNQKLLDDYGITEDLTELQNSGEWTWEKFTDIATRFNQNAPEEIRALYEWHHAYNMLLGSHKTDWISRDSNTGMYSFGAGNERAQEALSMYRDLAQLGVITIEDDHEKGLGKKGFYAGNAAFFIESLFQMRWGIQPSATNDVKENWGIVTIPQLEPGVENIQAIGVNDALGYAIPYGVENPKEVATILNQWILVEMDPAETKQAFIEHNVMENLNVATGDLVLDTVSILYDICVVEGDFRLNNSFTSHTEPGIGAWTVGSDDSWYTHARNIALGNSAMGSTITSMTQFFDNILAEFTRVE